MKTAFAAAWRMYLLFACAICLCTIGCEDSTPAPVREKSEYSKKVANITGSTPPSAVVTSPGAETLITGMGAPPDTGASTDGTGSPPSVPVLPGTAEPVTASHPATVSSAPDSSVEEFEEYVQEKIDGLMKGGTVQAATDEPVPGSRQRRLIFNDGFLAVVGHPFNDKIEKMMKVKDTITAIKIKDVCKLRREEFCPDTGDNDFLVQLEVRGKKSGTARVCRRGRWNGSGWEIEKVKGIKDNFDWDMAWLRQHRAGTP